MAKKDGEEPQKAPKVKKIPLRKYTLKEDYVTDKGIIPKGDKIELSKEGATLLKQQNKI